MAKTQKIVLVVGDEGCVLVQVEGKQVLQRLFAATPDYPATRPFRECFDANPTPHTY